jgi:hypothetical protein
MVLAIARNPWPVMENTFSFFVGIMIIQIPELPVRRCNLWEQPPAIENLVIFFLRVGGPHFDFRKVRDSPWQNKSSTFRGLLFFGGFCWIIGPKTAGCC